MVRFVPLFPIPLPGPIQISPEKIAGVALHIPILKGALQDWWPGSRGGSREGFAMIEQTLGGLKVGESD